MWDLVTGLFVRPVEMALGRLLGIPTFAEVVDRVARDVTARVAAGLRGTPEWTRSLIGGALERAGAETSRLTQYGMDETFGMCRFVTMVASGGITLTCTVYALYSIVSTSNQFCSDHAGLMCETSRMISLVGIGFVTMAVIQVARGVSHLFPKNPQRNAVAIEQAEPPLQDRLGDLPHLIEVSLLEAPRAPSIAAPPGATIIERASGAAASAQGAPAETMTGEVVQNPEAPPSGASAVSAAERASAALAERAVGTVLQVPEVAPSPSTDSAPGALNASGEPGTPTTGVAGSVEARGQSSQEAPRPVAAQGGGWVKSRKSHPPISPPSRG